jgi:type IV pilus assembly protein PilY1
LEAIGQTWSAARVAKIPGYTDTATPTPNALPVLVMGGGYDPCEDADPDTCGTTKGNRIFVLDADTGDKLAELNTDRGVVGDVFVITDETTGLAKWAYAADLGGNIYRISSGTGANTEFQASDWDGTNLNWTITKIAALGCATAAACTPNRKFMMSLDIVEDLDGSYVILAGTGDREKPLEGFTSAYGVNNYFFKVVDRPTVATWLSDETSNCTGQSVICFHSLFEIAFDDGDPSASDMLAHPKGLALGLRDHEQVVTSAITVFGTTTFSTHVPHVPAEGSCVSTLGTARVYNIDFSNAAAANGTLSRSEVIVGGGLPPSPVAGMVTLDDGTTMPFLIGGDPNSPLEGMEPIPSGLAAQPKTQTYWYIHK